ncbi:hypothetical protein B0H15DRAFT_954986 [Mycena belliarum]|uniref:Uncharacterized protein n=1 Tax=Mycena belliarum TaxID=1033014 RepID=A0AAD6XNY1_9AGAR|nr:hypothetical protein B0H15DRAFT_954986 [Mycena belliae]
MHSTPAPISTAQRVAEASSPVAHTHETEVKPVNHNGPQCCHCGWRGGEHACVAPSSRLRAFSQLTYSFLQIQLPFPVMPASRTSRPLMLAKISFCHGIVVRAFNLLHQSATATPSRLGLCSRLPDCLIRARRSI